VEQLRRRIAETAEDRAQLKGWSMTDLWRSVVDKGHAITYPKATLLKPSLPSSSDTLVSTPMIPRLGD
jgi:hypothetical protein